MLFRNVALGALWLVVSAASPQTFYAPTTNLELIDAELINEAEETIDFAAYSLTDEVVIEALQAARIRGVKLRIVLDRTQGHAYERFFDLFDDIRLSRPGPIMHLKSYAVDGKVLRSGSANLSHGGLVQQDNDLIIMRDEASAQRFEENRFEEIWRRAEPLSVIPAVALPNARHRRR